MTYLTYHEKYDTQVINLMIEDENNAYLWLIKKLFSEGKILHDELVDNYTLDDMKKFKSSKKFKKDVDKEFEEDTFDNDSQLEVFYDVCQFILSEGEENNDLDFDDIIKDHNDSYYNDGWTYSIKKIKIGKEMVTKN